MTESTPEDLGRPMPRRGARDAMSTRQAIALRRPATASGAVEAPPGAREFMERARRDYRFDEQPLSDERLPNWVRAHVQRQTPVEELLAELERRVARAPTEESLHLALALANEMGRTPEGARALRGRITPQLVDGLTDARHPGASQRGAGQPDEGGDPSGGGGQGDHGNHGEPTA